MNKLIKSTDRPFYDLAKRFFDTDFDVELNPFFLTSRNYGGLSNILEKENEYLIELSAPGLKKEDIKIELENDILKISSSVENETEEKNEGYYRREFHKASFERNFTVPKNVNRDEISATMENGILNVSIPKVKEEKKNENIKITIK